MRKGSSSARRLPYDVVVLAVGSVKQLVCLVSRNTLSLDDAQEATVSSSPCIFTSEPTMLRQSSGQRAST